MSQDQSSRRSQARNLLSGGACLGLLSLVTLVAAPAQKRQATTTPDAYVIVGDLDQAWYTEMAYGDVYRLAEPLIQKKIAELKKMGYTVKKIDSATVAEFQRVLQNPRTKAIAWFGHGDPTNPGSVTAFGQNQQKIHVGTDQLRTWAEEKWAKARGWDGKSNRETWLRGKARNDEQFNRMKVEMERASFGLDYGYFHTCYGFDKKDLAKVMMKPDAGSRFFGYKGKKYGFDETGAYQAAWLNNRVEIGDPKVIEPKRQQALAASAAGAANPAGGASKTAAKSVPEKTEDKAPTAPETAEADKAKVEKPAAREKTEPTAKSDDEDEEIDVFKTPAKTVAKDMKKTAPVEPVKVDPEKEARRRVRRAETVEKSEDEEGEVEFKEEAPSTDEEKNGEAAPGPPAESKTQPKEPAWDTNIDNFDGDYSGHLQSGKPFRMKVQNGGVTIIIEDIQLKGRVDKKGHVTASWQGEVGEIENPNPGSLKIVKLMGKFNAEGDISGKIAAGSLRVEVNAPALGEAPQVNQDHWSCSR